MATRCTCGHAITVTRCSPQTNGTLNMKITSEDSTPIAEILNPRGNLAKELEMTCKKAGWLSLMCGYWLAYHHDNAELARRDEPYRLPQIVPNAARFNLTLKNCGLYERRAPLKDGTTTEIPCSRLLSIRKTPRFCLRVVPDNSARNPDGGQEHRRAQRPRRIAFSGVEGRRRLV